ncbi:polysaccharide pyruvyl transferase family protein [Rheinheimera baltica]|uniref:Polysaccharide pyruvyl transferase family protein n=1 Tax=Rheinheimera baltica TaxID=67576 RepID=A0ABT9I3D6_9GAMM|nr:polysaccharide pyruvyl transferase family protein [Rheinheimera baltica]MDP5137884.1 polysaccharide pyruvyl transferase family protein [Rheinheimera baltica]MDP5149767.1 polysaccharide pyruvyl transferase family protein [Rheinheimera baltica]
MRVILFNDTSGNRHYGCEFVVENLSIELQRRGMLLHWSNPVGVDWRNDANMLPSPNDFDVILVNGEGSIHHDATRPRAQWLAQVSEWASNINKPAFLINATLQDLTNNCLNAISRFQKILVRESSSLALLTKHGIQAQLCGDLTLLTQWEPNLSTESRYSLLVTDSVLPDNRVALRRFAARSGYLFRPMKPRQNEAITRKDFVHMITQAEKVITGRFHTVTLCLLTGTPVLATESNTVKISSTLQDALGNKNRVFDISELASLSEYHNYYYTTEEKLHLQHYLQQCKQRWKTFFDELTQYS